MSAPLNQEYGQFPGHSQAAEQPAQAEHAPQDYGAAPTKKKKRGYAAQAFEVGAGANAGVGGQGQGGGPPYGTPVSATGGYPLTEPQQVPASQGYQQYPQAPGFPPQPGGYQAPDQGYNNNVAPHQPGAPGVADITQGMGGMNIAGQGHPQPPYHQTPYQQVPYQQPQFQQPAAAPAQQPARAGPLNQLFPVDLVNTPISVAELDAPPPPIILPPNVSCSALQTRARSREQNADQNRYSVAVKRDPVSCGQLPFTIRPVHHKRSPFDQLLAEKVQAPLCVGHPAIRRTSR